MLDYQVKNRSCQKNMHITANKMLSPREAAALAGVTVLTMRRWLKAMKGPRFFTTPTGRFKISAEDMTEWMTARQHGDNR